MTQVDVDFLYYIRPAEQSDTRVLAQPSEKRDEIPTLHSRTIHKIKIISTEKWQQIELDRRR